MDAAPYGVRALGVDGRSLCRSPVSSPRPPYLTSPLLICFTSHCVLAYIIALACLWLRLSLLLFLFYTLTTTLTTTSQTMFILYSLAV